MTNESGYTLNSRGLRRVEAAARAWSVDARRAFDAGQPIPDRSAYMPSFLEDDEDYRTFYRACYSCFDPDAEMAKRDLMALDRTSPEAWARHARRHECHLPQWLHWLAIGHSPQTDMAALILMAANEYAAWISPRGSTGRFKSYDRAKKVWIMEADSGEEWRYDRGATPKEVAFVGAVACALKETD